MLYLLVFQGAQPTLAYQEEDINRWQKKVRVHNVMRQNKLLERISKTAGMAAEPLCVHLETQECFQVSLDSHTGCIWQALKPQNIMHLKSSPWPLRSTDWCFNQRPWKTADKHTLLHFQSSFCLSFNFLCMDSEASFLMCL